MAELGTQDGQWWLQPAELLDEARRRTSRSVESARYRFGDGLLEIESDHAPLLDTLRLWYRDCAVTEASASCNRIPFSVRKVDGSLVLTQFPRPDDPAEAAAALRVFDSFYRVHYTRSEDSATGWRLMYGSSDKLRPFAATNGFDALVDVNEEPEALPPGFLANYIMSAVMALQPGVLFVHAASVGINGAAALFMGRGGAGKTTLSLALAARGHAFFGDNQACLRIKSREVVPFPRSASIKPGPRAQVVNESLERGGTDTIELPDGRTAILMPVARQFPSSRSSPLPLRAFFYLRRLADRPSLERFRPAMTEHDFVRRLSGDSTALFGVSPARRWMNVLLLMELLAEVPCFYLEAGTPEATADLIERTMESL